MWLDGIERKYVEEVGSMNIFFVIDNVLVTAPLNSGSILGGITRDSVIKYARYKGYEVQERKLAISEVFEAHERGSLNEVFGTGTAAVISPVGVLRMDDKEIIIIIIKSVRLLKCFMMILLLFSTVKSRIHSGGSLKFNSKER